MSDIAPFDIVQESGVTIAAFKPGNSQIDERIVDSVNRQLVELAAGLPSPALVLDLTHVEFFGSSFIEAMFRVWKRLQTSAGAKFALCGLQPYCREVLEVTHLDQLWTITATRAEAIAALRQQ
jgi:anti-anti-sigma factor